MIQNEKIKTISGLIASIFIPIVLLVLGNDFSKSLKEKDLALSYVKLATGILMEQPSDEKKQIRDWAANIINYYSEVKMSESLIKDLENKVLDVYDADDEFEDLNKIITNKLNSKINFPNLDEEQELEVIKKIYVETLNYKKQGLELKKIKKLVKIPFVDDSKVEQVIVLIFNEL